MRVIENYLSKLSFNDEISRYFTEQVISVYGYDPYLWTQPENQCLDFRFIQYFVARRV